MHNVNINNPPISDIVFDLDGTLYVADGFAATIRQEATAFMAKLLKCSPEQADRVMAETRCRLAEENDSVPTLSAACSRLGGTLPDMHAWFESCLNPETHLVRDQQVVELIARLRRKCGLHIYTNNNRVLTTRIIDYLGLSGMFTHIFTIDDTWRPKPDRTRLEQLLALTGHPAQQVLFVGDRYDVDLRLPEQLGCPVYLSQNLEQLLRLETVLG
ncbi:MAG TPA: HAD family hydrolase [Deltaproteobacteria bacterium]|nr:HAD family hydrolase [Deltaproteobacteria bacterium]HQB39696.1 HAD family hydrolase [Deltaproteobacteria bacterium]